MKIRLAAAAAAAVAAPILLPATHALASTTHVASPATVSHVSGCGFPGGINFLGGGFHHCFHHRFFFHPFVPVFHHPCFNELGGLGGIGGIGGIGGLNGAGGLDGLGGLGGLYGPGI